MALVKCEECGQMISDKAISCPHCGCPITIQDRTNEQKEVQVNSDVIEEKPQKSKGLIYATLAILAIAGIAGIIYMMNSATKNGDASNEKLIGVSVPTGKYCIILQNDNYGEFIAPNGGHICGVEKRDRGSEYTYFKMTKTLTILGHNTKDIYIFDNNLFADRDDHSDFLYNNGQNFATVMIEKQEGGVTIYTIDFKDGQIDPQEPPLHQIDFPEDQYTFVYYKDASGAVYGPGNKYICGLEKMVLEGEFHFTKTVTIYGEPYDRLFVRKNKLWKSTLDPIDDDYADPGEESKSLADVSYKEEGDMILAHFPITATFPRYVSGSADNSSSTNNETSSSTSSQWRITSVEQLKNRLDGTIWTCRPAGQQWYRLVFSNGKVTLYYASPSLGQWAGGDETHVYNCEIKEGHSSYDGEKYIAAALVKDDHTWGGLMFFKNGDVEFTWLNGQQGGPAECKDYNWE